LRQRRLRDHLERFPGRIRNKMQVEAIHTIFGPGTALGLWIQPGINHGKESSTSMGIKLSDFPVRFPGWFDHTGKGFQQAWDSGDRIRLTARMLRFATAAKGCSEREKSGRNALYPISTGPTYSINPFKNILYLFRGTPCPVRCSKP
jgi:hypothetical protein